MVGTSMGSIWRIEKLICFDVMLEATVLFKPKSLLKIKLQEHGRNKKKWNACTQYKCPDSPNLDML